MDLVQSLELWYRQADTVESETSADANLDTPSSALVLTFSDISIPPSTAVVTSVVTRLVTGDGIDPGPIVVTVTASSFATDVLVTSDLPTLDDLPTSSPAATTSEPSNTWQISSTTKPSTPSYPGPAGVPVGYALLGAGCGIVFTIFLVVTILSIRKCNSRRRKQRDLDNEHQVPRGAGLCTQETRELHEAGDGAKPPELPATARAELEGHWHGWEASPRAPVIRCSMIGDDARE